MLVIVGVGVVSLRGAPLPPSVPCTQDFKSFVGLGRVLRCVVPVQGGRIVRVVVVCRFQGAETDTEKLAQAEQLFQAVLCELRAVGQGHPKLVLDDFNVEPSMIHCLVEGIAEGSWIDFTEQLSAGGGNLPAPTCKNVWDSVGTRRDFILGCPSAFAPCSDCWVDDKRWLKPHFSVRAENLGRWSALMNKNRTFSPHDLHAGSSVGQD